MIIKANKVIAGRKKTIVINERFSGIYKITNLINSKIYIGSSIDILKRLSEHFNDLSKNIHPNYHLQNSYNTHGLDNFTYEVVETILFKDKNYILEREQHYIDTLKPEYNIAKIAGSNLDFKHSEETKKKISKSRKKRYELNPPKSRFSSKEEKDKAKKEVYLRYYYKNKEKRDNDNKERSLKNKDELKEYRKSRKEITDLNNKKYYEENKEKLKQQAREYRKRIKDSK